ncbi:MAG TPA: hypothetical protein VMY37_08330 [Thermoguttaceae bacterium]|nr:hypothetical protein [Thermoguttaceae bacterium]
MKEVALRAAGDYANPYTDCAADVVLTEPDGKTTRSTPLFWDGGKTRSLTQPPAATYGCLAESGRRYVVYGRGLKKPVELSLKASSGSLSARQFDPRTGESKTVVPRVADNRLTYQPPGDRDCVLLLECKM